MCMRVTSSGDALAGTFEFANSSGGNNNQHAGKYSSYFTEAGDRDTLSPLVENVWLAERQRTGRCLGRCRDTRASLGCRADGWAVFS